ncbi:hypothetical protein NTE_01172 [Candidatus Nitrososphaera evergladensis SR1]|uniref:Uncharacterized protein n=1 Tax=Candidatus Nitrososphaera evergladensis SR1 TaxID=1459636 RepID=A0A075MQ98_9ARCH|nr:hypothetical protein NTE_01172 [Candidatus Nitrososphaera evergladensis SR1]
MPAAAEVEEEAEAAGDQEKEEGQGTVIRMLKLRVSMIIMYSKILQITLRPLALLLFDLTGKADRPAGALSPMSRTKVCGALMNLHIVIIFSVATRLQVISSISISLHAGAAEKRVKRAMI